MAHVHRSVAALRIFGDALVPDEISALLGARPTDAHNKGDRIVSRTTGGVRIAKGGTWRLDATPGEPENLDGQIHEVLGRLTDDLGVWAGIAEQFEIDLFCGLFIAGGNEGLTLSAQALAALGQRGIELGLDIYGPDDD